MPIKRFALDIALICSIEAKIQLYMWEEKRKKKERENNINIILINGSGSINGMDQKQSDWLH